MKTKLTSSAAFFNARVLIGFALCSIGLVMALAGLSHSMTGTVVSVPDSTRWYVDGVNGNDSNDCRSPITACKTIGHAISLAASGDSISVAAATYMENLTIGVSVKITGAITGASDNTTVIDGGAVDRVITISSGAQVTLSRFTIQNGHAFLGAGIKNDGTLTLSNSIVSGNSAVFGGGGIYNNARLTINNSTLSGNTASVYSYVAKGGGILNDGTLTINNSTLSGNAANSFYPAEGGGIYNSVSLTINNSSLSGNTASSTRPAQGGGIYNVGTLTISNTTIAGNAATQGGNIYNHGSSLTFQNSIVANTASGGNCSGVAVTSNGYNLSSDGTCNFNNTGDLNNTNPILGPLQDNGGPTKTQALLFGSPAIDAGNPGGCTDGQGRLLRTDQRGEPRPDHEDTSGCDMGAYESQSD
jgi:hypothetical protein